MGCTVHGERRGVADSILLVAALRQRLPVMPSFLGAWYRHALRYGMICLRVAWGSRHVGGFQT